MATLLLAPHPRHPQHCHLGSFIRKTAAGTAPLPHGMAVRSHHGNAKPGTGPREDRCVPSPPARLSSVQRSHPRPNLHEEAKPWDVGRGTGWATRCGSLCPRRCQRRAPRPLPHQAASPEPSQDPGQGRAAGGCRGWGAAPSRQPPARRVHPNVTQQEGLRTDDQRAVRHRKVWICMLSSHRGRGAGLEDRHLWGPSCHVEWV